MGELSDPWPRVSISDVCETIVDCLNRTAPTVSEPTPYKMIRTTNVRDGWINLENVKYVDEPTYQRWTRRQVPRQGDVVLTREAPLGEVGMIRTNEPVFLGQRLVSYRADEAVLDSRYLLYAFLERDLQGQIKALGSGATVEHMRVPDAKRLTLRLPPLPAQRRIASILSAYDDLIENNTRRIEILEEMVRRLYQEWFVHFRFPGREDVAVDADLPEGWGHSPLNAITQFINRGIAPRYDDEANCRVINQKCIRDQRLNMELARSQSKRVPDDKLVQLGDVLINSTGVGTLGRVAQVCEAVENCTVDSHVTIVRADGNLDRDYFGLALLHLQRHFEGLGVGATGQTELSRARVAETEIAVPPTTLQEQFGDMVRPMRSLCMALVAKNSNLRAQRDLMLPKLVSGEIDVSELDQPALEAAE